MAAVQKFDRKMIEKFMQSHQLRYLVDSDGIYILEIDYNEKMGCAIKTFLSVEGNNKDRYRIYSVSDRRISKSEWGQAALLCNTWNMERSYQKAYLRLRDNDSFGIIVLESSIDLEQGIHQELLDDFTMIAISGALVFWEWIHKERGF